MWTVKMEDAKNGQMIGKGQTMGVRIEDALSKAVPGWKRVSTNFARADPFAVY